MPRDKRLAYDGDERLVSKTAPNCARLGGGRFGGPVTRMRTTPRSRET